MAEASLADNFKTILSIDPLLDFWREKMAPQCDYLTAMFETFEKRIRETPELLGDIDQPDIAARHTDILSPLMMVAIPFSTWETDITAAFRPFRQQALFYTPTFSRLLLDGEGNLAGNFKDNNEPLDHQRLLRAYALILKRLYGIDQGQVESPLIRIVTGSKSGLERHLQIIHDFQFVQVQTVGTPRKLTDPERNRVIENIADPEALISLLPPADFIFRGFVVLRAIDVTESEITSALERDLIDRESIFSADGFTQVQNRLRILFGQSDIKAGLTALQGDQVLILNDGHRTGADCLFTNSSHIPLSKVKSSIWVRAAKHKEIRRIPDLTLEPDLCPVEKEIMAHGVRSMLVAPLQFGGQVIGLLSLKSKRPNALGAVESEKMRHIAPLFSMALKRGLDDMNNKIQAIIKEKCTAVHPSVEWRFHKAAMDHMDRLREGKTSEMEPIIFKDVVPLFGQSDIRGSSEARVESIQADLTEQLTLAGEIMKQAARVKSWPLIDEFSYRIEKRIGMIKAGLSTEEESTIAAFLQAEVVPSFAELRAVGPGVSHAIDTYMQAVDPVMGMVYHRRKAFEESVSLLNERLSAYLDRQQAKAQQIFPHYFEKHQTDGIDYVIYIGASMHPQGKDNPFYLKNLMLWQLKVACGLALQTRQVRPELKMPLDTCHLILINQAPLSIRFRYDEKRFDVDGAYDVRHEIIKSRLDKAKISGGRERLTQPDRIAIVYSRPSEGWAIRRHIEYLQSREHLLEDLETIDLEDLPGVRGLKALRVGVNLEAAAASQGIRRMAG
jgi:hypothetical protein